MLSKIAAGQKIILKLSLILILYLILASAYSIVVPIGRGADEWAHYWYARFIAQNGRLPANPAEREAAGYKSDWPPLYHLFATGLTAWIDTDGPPTFKYRLDNIRRQLVPAMGPEAILHTEDELFPWQQEILVWRLGRFLSISFTLATLLVTYFIALEVFANNKVAGKYPIQNPKSKIQNGLVSVAVLAFSPRFLFTGMLFNYDSLTLLLASLFLWLAIRVVKGYYPRWGFWGLGVLAGLALTTKYLAALLPLEIILVALIRSSNRQTRETAIGKSTANHYISRFNRPFALHLGQAALAFLLVTSWWFGYLLINFNEIDTYGPVLGVLAPLIRGDGSDRTVEEIFARLGGDQAPPPAYIEKQSYTAWQIITELPTTFWGNPITRPYPLNWFIIAITAIIIIAAAGLVMAWRTSRFTPPSSLAAPTPQLCPILSLLLLHSVLPLPFMFIRLFGARDALEAVQGRHILFLSGPAVAILLVLGLNVVMSKARYQLTASRVANITFYVLRFTFYVLRFMFHILLGLLLTGAISQLIFMWSVYPPLLPVRTTGHRQINSPPAQITLPGGARLIDYSLAETGSALKVSLIWQAGQAPPPEDYQMELALVDAQGHTQSGWLAYQTQAHYPTRAWEEGDIIRDEGWLPLLGLAAGDYKINMRFLGQAGEVIPWQTLSIFNLLESSAQPSGATTGSNNKNQPEWILWQQGKITHSPPLLHQRKTAQFTIPNPQSPIPNLQPATPNPQSPISNLQLIGPDGVAHLPPSAGTTWANFIIGPNWPPGDYRSQAQGKVVLRVASNDRNFQVPAEMKHQLEADFEGQVKLLGYRLPTHRVQPGDGLPITLYWQGLQWMGEEFVIFNRLLDNQQVAWGGYDRLAKEHYSTLLWAPGEIVIDGFAVPVAPESPAGVYVLDLGWYRLVEGEAKSLLIINPETGKPTGATSVIIGPIKMGGPPSGATVEEATPEVEVNIVLGEQIELLGFDVSQNTSSLDFTFYWQVLARPETDYTVFVHVRNAAGEVVAQKDRPPVAGTYPTSLWDAGEIIKDEISVSLEGLAPGEYEVGVGMYDFMTGMRLPVNGLPEGTIWLQSFRIDD